jgi:hypothetical protein
VRFSERIGILKRVLQKDSMDEALKNALWNAVYVRYWLRYRFARTEICGSAEGELILCLWVHHFDQPADKLNTTFCYAIEDVAKRFEASHWHQVYDFIQEVVEFAPPNVEEFIAYCNNILERHMSAYRFIGTTLSPITSEVEIAAVGDAITHRGRFAAASAHLATALSRLSDRTSPDYRNAIKESISAVESVCKVIVGDDRATLVQALKQIGLHPALEKGLGNIYGYTSDADGIRHAMMDKSMLTGDDARFFLVSCSAFVNYLVTKSSLVSRSES